MTKSVDDVHCIEAGYLNANQRFGNANIGKENKALIEIFSIALQREGAMKTTITWYLYYVTWMVEQLQDLGFNETLDKLDPDIFDRLLISFEAERKLSPALSKITKNGLKNFLNAPQVVTLLNGLWISS